MSDILDDLMKPVNAPPHDLGEPSMCLVEHTVLLRAVAEIERLRADRDHMLALAGRVSVGPSYADIAKDARHEVPVSEHDNG